MKLQIINGPNLNLLGEREPTVYGNNDFNSHLEELKKKFPSIEFEYFQSNVEGELIDAIQQKGYDGKILNAAGYTHTSVAMGDAVKAIDTPVVEVHISNVMDRESFRHVSYISAGCAGVISGFGLKSYELAVESFVR